MNRRGFTLVELLATIIVLAIVVGIAVPSVSSIIKKSKERSEETFVETIKDAMDVYLSSSARSLQYNTCFRNGAYSYAVVYDETIGRGRNVRFQDVIDSLYHPIDKGSLMNPANSSFCTGNNEKIGEKDFISTTITIFRNNTTYAYYYRINKKDFYGVNELTDGSGLKKGTSSESCFKYTIEDEYISNLENPGDFVCY